MAWRRARFKGGVVLARCEDDGTLRAEGGRVEIRYRPRDSRAYRAGLRNLSVIDTEPVLPDDTCPEGEPVKGAADKAKGKAKAKAKAKGKSGAKAGTVLEAPPEGSIIAWTDGACSGNPGPAGLGVVLIDGDARRELSEYLGQATNNIAELTAIARALEAIGDAHDGRPVRVYTDSQYSIGVLTKGWKAKANQQLVAHLRALVKSFPDLELIYVRGHVGVELNERADQLAVQAVQDRDTAGWLEA